MIRLASHPAEWRNLLFLEKTNVHPKKRQAQFHPGNTCELNIQYEARRGRAKVFALEDA
jgi:hypothetical protein